MADATSSGASARTNAGDAAARLLAPEAVLRALPASPEALATVRAARARLRGPGAGVDPSRSRWLRLAGPPRLLDAEAAFAAARALRREARERLARGDGPVLVMRTFVEALVRDPLRDGSRDLNLGLATARQLLLRINELGVPCAIEAPAPGEDDAGLAVPYLEDLVVCQVGRPAHEPVPARRPARAPLSDAQLLRAPPQSVLAERR